MARRDVDLRIRAKADDAEKALESVTAALNEFKAAQKGIVSQSGDTKSSFSQLGTSIVQLDKAMKSFDDRFSGKVERAADKSAALTATVEKTSAALLESKRAFDAAEKAATKAADGLAKTTAKYNDARKAQEADTAALKKATAARDEAAGRRQRYADAIAKSSDKIASSAEGIEKYRIRVAELQAQLAVKPGNVNIGKSLESAQRQLTKFNEENRTSKAELRAAQAGYDRASVSVEKYGVAVAKADTAVKGSDKAVKRVTASLDQWKVKAKDTSREQNTLASEVEKTSARLTRETAELGKTEAALADVSGELGKAQAQFAAFSKQGFQGLRLDIGNQVRSVREAREVFGQLTDIANRMASEIGQVGVPTLEMARAFDLVKVQAREAKDELIEQTNTLGKLRQAYNQADGDASKLTATQQRFAQAHNESDAALRKVGQGAQVLRGELNGLYQGYARLQGNRIPNQNPQLREEATLVQRLRGLWAALGGEKRTSLSLVQRLRGEVLSMVAAYGGLFAVVDVLRRTVDAFQQLEAAQSRLGVATGGDAAKTAQELDFVRRMAERLGIEFGSLATEYSKFSIATQGTNLAGEKTRKIFTAVAEAARVNRSSNEDLKGVFTALTQIVSKGAVQMEELRQQLGDRLPGALQLMADGLGITSAELIKMTANGEITADALLPFADELSKRFGPGLGEALNSVTTAIGRMKNAAFQALLAFGKGGFLDAFKDLADTVTETLQSADFQEFVGNLSVVFATLTRLVATAVENFQLLFTAVSAIIALRLLPWVLGIVTAFQTAGFKAISDFRTSIMAAGAASTVAGAQMTAAAAGVRAFGVAIKSLLATTGIGLFLVAATTAFSFLATEADVTTEALVEHQRIVDALKDTYDVTGASLDKFREGLEGVTVSQAIASLKLLETQLNKALGDAIQYPLAIENLFEPTVGGLEETRIKLRDLAREFRDGNIPVEEYKRALEALLKLDPTLNKDLILDLLNNADGVKELEDAVKDARLAVATFSDDADEATGAIKELNGESDGSAESITKMAAAMGELEGFVAGLVEEAPKATSATETLAAAALALQTHYEAALRAARSLPDAIMRAAAEQGILNQLAEGYAALQRMAGEFVEESFGNFTDGAEAAAAILRQFEGFQPTGTYDVNAFRAGFGSDTVTLSDGTIKKVTEGMAVSVADANRDLLRRIGQEFLPAARNAVGASTFDALNAQQQGALVSLAYNYGAGAFQPGEALAGIAKAIRDGNIELAATLTANLRDNPGRRQQEAALLRSNGNIEGLAGEQVAADEARLEGLIDRANEAIERAEATQSRIADGNFEITQQELINAGKERQAAIEEAIREAKAENANITEAELAAIAEQTGRLFDLEQANKNILTTKEQAAAAEEEVNNLLSIRQSLMEQIKIAEEEGNTELQAQIKAKIDEINQTLIAAVENAKAFWTAVGGTEAAAALARLETVNVQARNFQVKAEQVFFSWKKVGELFTGGLADAFSTFAQELASGSSVFDSLRTAFLKFASDFLIQIGRMIVQQAIFNALKGSALGGFLGIAHKGDVIGRSSGRNQRRRVAPGTFAGAQRFHSGGMPGLRPNEVPIIAEKGEEVLSKSDPRNIMNGGGVQSSGTPDVNVTTINLFDPVAALEAALNSPAGGKLMVNHVAANSGKYRGALGT